MVACFAWFLRFVLPLVEIRLATRIRALTRACDHVRVLCLLACCGLLRCQNALFRSTPCLFACEQVPGVQEALRQHSVLRSDISQQWSVAFPINAKLTRSDSANRRFLRIHGWIHRVSCFESIRASFYFLSLSTCLQCTGTSDSIERFCWNCAVCLLLSWFRKLPLHSVLPRRYQSRFVASVSSCTVGSSRSLYLVRSNNFRAFLAAFRGSHSQAPFFVSVCAVGSSRTLGTAGDDEFLERMSNFG